jgi:hypothetical protein
MGKNFILTYIFIIIKNFTHLISIQSNIIITITNTTLIIR